YSLVPPTVELPSVKWADNHKQLFTLSIKPISTIHSLDEKLDNFFHLTNIIRKNIPNHQRTTASMGDGVSLEKEFKQSIQNSVQANPEALVHFFYILFDKLLYLLIRPPVLNGHIVNIGQTCFESLARIVQRIKDLLPDMNDSHLRNKLLVTYIHYGCTLHTTDS
ncbi:unnamed protein product, partial [Didymodactylos carnosus]